MLEITPFFDGNGDGKTTWSLSGRIRVESKRWKDSEKRRSLEARTLTCHDAEAGSALPGLGVGI